uniref:Uncharacterized protein n=1 Tax=Anopheles gambiae TaxID=7165 RepID=A0A1S4GIA2_ANOGA
MTSQRFCLRWNNHQTNLLAVFDQLLHDETFIDVTLAVEGQHLKAHKMVLSACSPYFQQLFVSHPEKHPIVILRDVPFKDMKCLLDFMYRGEVSVDQDRLAAFLRVAESLRIKGLTEVNDDKPNAPSGSASATATNSAGSAASSGAQATGATTTTNTVPNATVQKNSSGSSGMVAQVDDDEDDRCSPVPNSIAVAPNAASSGQAQGGHLKPLPPLLSSTGIVTRSHSNSLLQQGGSSAASGSAMVQTNPLLGTALSQQKRKRGRPRKLSGSDAGEGETEGNFVGGGGAPGEEYDSSSMDIMDVKIASSGASNSGDDDQQLRIVSSRTDDDDTLMHEKAEQLDDEDDEVMDDEADELVDDVDLEAGDEPRGTSPSLDESMEDTIGNMDGTTNNNGNTNRSGRQHQKQGTAAAKPSRASKRSRTRNNENSLSGSELSIFPINLEKKDRSTNAVVTNPINGAEEEEESDEEIEFILPKAYCAKFSDEAASNPSESRDGDTLPPLLQELKRNGHLQDVTIIERRRSFDVPLVHQTVNGTEDSPKEAKALKLDETDNDEPSDLRVRATAQDTPTPDAEAITELENRTDHINMLSGAFSAKPMRIPATAVTKRRTRHTISPNDPAKALTEMSVRGLDLFQYATINGGMYQVHGVR